MNLTEILANYIARRAERGASAVEYGLLIALIAAVIMGTMALLGGSLQAAYQSVVTGFQNNP